jgi:RNA polymerase sigma-70 factor (ECF subfamily)
MSRLQSLNYKKLVDAHCTSLYRFAYCLAHDEQTASDLTQHTFFLYANKGAALGDGVKIKPWLFATLHREFLRQRTAPHVETPPQATPPSGATDVAALDGPAAAAMLAHVEERLRAPLALYYLRELTYREIAEVLETTVENILARVAEGKARLTQILAGRAEQN